MDMEKLRELEELLGRADKNNVLSISGIDMSIASLGYKILNQNSWAIEICDKEENPRSANHILVTITSGIDTYAVANPKKLFNYKFYSHFIIRECINGPYELPYIIVCNPQNLDHEYNPLFIRHKGKDLEVADAILCGEKPDTGGSITNLDYLVLESTGKRTPIDRNSYDSRYGLMMESKEKSKYTVYQEVPLMFFKSKRVRRNIGTFSTDTPSRKFLWGHLFHLGARINQHMRASTEQQRKLEEVAESKKYTIEKAVISSDPGYGIILRYVVFRGPREGRIMCDRDTFNAIMTEYNKHNEKNYQLDTILSHLGNKLKLDKIDINDKIMPNDKDISQKVNLDGNRELAVKIANNLLIK